MILQNFWSKSCYHTLTYLQNDVKAPRERNQPKIEDKIIVCSGLDIVEAKKYFPRKHFGRIVHGLHFTLDYVFSIKCILS